LIKPLHNQATHNATEDDNQQQAEQAEAMAFFPQKPCPVVN